MMTSTKTDSVFFYRTLAAVAMIGPILLVFAAGTLPEGLERSDLILNGFGVLLAALTGALAIRTSYALGFSKALKTLQRRSGFNQVTA